MSEVKKFFLVPKELWENIKNKLSELSSEIYKKNSFSSYKKAKEEVSSEEVYRPHRELKTDLELYYKKTPIHWKLRKRYTKTSVWNFFFPVELLLTTLKHELIWKRSIIQLKWKTLHLKQTISWFLKFKIWDHIWAKTTSRGHSIAQIGSITVSDRIKF